MVKLSCFPGHHVMPLWLQLNGKMLQALVTTMDSWCAPFEVPMRMREFHVEMLEFVGSYHTDVLGIVAWKRRWNCETKWKPSEGIWKKCLGSQVPSLRCSPFHLRLGAIYSWKKPGSVTLLNLYERCFSSEIRVGFPLMTSLFIVVWCKMIGAYVLAHYPDIQLIRWPTSTDYVSTWPIQLERTKKRL